MTDNGWQVHRSHVARLVPRDEEPIKRSYRGSDQLVFCPMTWGKRFAGATGLPLAREHLFNCVLDRVEISIKERMSRLGGPVGGWFVAVASLLRLGEGQFEPEGAVLGDEHAVDVFVVDCPDVSVLNVESLVGEEVVAELWDVGVAAAAAAVVVEELSSS